MDETVKNSAPGNGSRTGPGSPQEQAPLKPQSQRYHQPIGRFETDLDELDGPQQQPPDKLATCAHKCRLTPKRGLIYLLVCGIIIFILLIVLIFLLAIWPTSYSRNLCQTADCHLLVSQILRRVNDTVEPCEDFWEFGCGSWLRENPIPKSRSHWSTESVENLKVKEKIRTLINTQTVKDEANSVDLKVKKFYEACMNIDFIKADEDRQLKKIIEPLGGWHVLRTYRERDFNFLRTMTEFHGTYRLSPFFQIKVISDPRTPSKSMIMISPGGLSLPDKSYYFKPKDSVAVAFHYFAKDIVQNLGASGDIAVEFAQEIFEYEKRIARVTPDLSNMTDPVANFHKITVKELNSKSKRLHWYDLLTGIFPQGQVNDNTDVLIPSLKYLEDISAIVSSTDTQILNNYLMWHLVLKYSTYLHSPFLNVHHIFQQVVTGIQEPLPRWEYCVDETLKFFPLAISGLLAENCEGREKKREKIDTMFDNIKDALSKRLSDSSGITEGWRKFATDKLHLMSIQIGTPIQNNSVLADLYLPIVAQSNFFFTSVISATTFKLKQEQVDLATLSKDTTTLWAITNSPFSITYIPSVNKVVVPESFLQNPILLFGSSHLPILYGSIGVQLGEAIAKAFGPEQGLFLATGDLMPSHDPKVQETRELIESKRVCLSSFFTSIRLDDESYIERTSLDTLLHLGGVQIAFDAYKSLGISPSSLPSLQDFSANALYFISYGQSQCSSSTLAFHDLEHSTSASLSHDHRIKGLLRQLVGFTDSLTCSRSSEMYADFSCGYFI